MKKGGGEGVAGVQVACKAHIQVGRVLGCPPEKNWNLDHLIPYCLTVTPCSLLRPPPYFRAKLLYRVFYLHYTPPPPPLATRAGLRYCSSCTCTRVASVEDSCIKNWSWPFSLISDDFLRPSSLPRGRWEESGCETTCYVLQKMATCTWPTTLPSFSAATTCRSRLLRHYRVREFVGGGGGA